MRKVFILPNLFTAGSLFFGMLAIFEAFNDDLRQACWLIVLSALFDAADGAIARLTRTASAFGLNFDSLADLVAFGAAPSLIAYTAMGSTFPRLAAAVCSLYTVCGAMRLARYNVQAMREERKTFTGLPIPGAALAVISVVWVYELNPEAVKLVPLAFIGPPIMVVLAYLMVSKVPYVGLKSINVTGRQPFELLVTIVVIVCLLFLLKQHLDLVLVTVSWSYILIGLVRGLILRSTQPAEDPETSAPSRRHASSQE